MKTYRILILEDDLETLACLLKELYLLEERLGQKVAVTIFSEYWQVEDYLNTSPKEKFEIILLDRDCKAGGSFHVLDFEKFKEAQIIGISSIPKYNQDLLEKGITKIVHKDYQNLKTFSLKVTTLIEELIKQS
jgi:hypothetical protein